jgi:hypothetical protein
LQLMLPQTGAIAVACRHSRQARADARHGDSEPRRLSATTCV